MQSLRGRIGRSALCGGVLSLTIASAAYADSLSGHVTTDDPAPVALVGVSVIATSATGQTLPAVVTNAAGFYTFDGIPAGTYYLRTLNAQGYIDELYNDIQCGGTCPGFVQTGEPVTVTGTVTNIDFALHLGGRVSGTVTGTDAGGLINVQVQVIDATGATIATVMTNAAGFYITGTGLPSGTYYARTANNPSGYLNELYDDFECPSGCNTLFGTGIMVVEGVTAGPVDFALSPGGRVQGTIVDAVSLAPIQGVNVTVVDVTGRFSTNGNTNAAGVYITGNGLPAGTYFARARATQIAAQGHIDEVYNNKPCPTGCPTISGDSFVVTVPPLPATTTIDFDLNSAGVISGTVTDVNTGDPLSGVTIQIFDESGRGFAQGNTGPFGIFNILAGLPNGTYYARTGNNLGYVNQLWGGASCVPFNCVVTAGDPIVVASPAPTPAVNFALSAGGRVSGHISSGGTPLRNISVNIFDSSGNNVGGAFTNSAGDYLSAAGLTTADYFVRTNNGQGFVNELYDNNICLGAGSLGGPCVVTNGLPVHVDQGVETPDINFNLDAGGRISGAMTLTGGTPLPGPGVLVYDGSGQPVTNGGADALGNYLTSGGVPAGSYFVRTLNNQGLVNEVYDNNECVTSCVPTNGMAVGVSTGVITPFINFELRFDTDTDGDGITSTVDTDPGTFSNDFSDVALGGSTSGAIAARGTWNLSVFAHPLGILLQVQGASAAPALIDTCAAGGAERVILDAVVEAAIVTCTGNSTTVRAATANPTIELREPPVGPGTVVVLTTGQTATLGSPVTASPNNTESVTVKFVDAAGVAFGSFALDPGESVATVVNANGSVEAEVIVGVVTLTVRDEVITLHAGQEESFPPAAVLNAVGPVNFWLGLKNSDDVGTRFDVLAEVLDRNGAIVATGETDNLAGGSSGFNNAILRTVGLALTSSNPVPMTSGDSISIRLKVRIAVGVSGHRSGTARVWFNDAAANSQLAATIAGGPNTYYLIGTTSAPAAFALKKDAAGSGPKSTADVLVDRLKDGNAFKTIGTWKYIVP